MSLQFFLLLDREALQYFRHIEHLVSYFLIACILGKRDTFHGAEVIILRIFTGQNPMIVRRSLFKKDPNRVVFLGEAKRQSDPGIC